MKLPHQFKLASVESVNAVNLSIENAKAQIESLNVQEKEAVDALKAKHKIEIDGAKANFTERTEALKRQIEGYQHQLDAIKGSAATVAKQKKEEADALAAEAKEIEKTSIKSKK